MIGRKTAIHIDPDARELSSIHECDANRQTGPEAGDGSGCAARKFGNDKARKVAEDKTCRANGSGFRRAYGAAICQVEICRDAARQNTGSGSRAQGDDGCHHAARRR